MSNTFVQLAQAGRVYGAVIDNTTYTLLADTALNNTNVSVLLQSSLVDGKGSVDKLVSLFTINGNETTCEFIITDADIATLFDGRTTNLTLTILLKNNDDDTLFTALNTLNLGTGGGSTNISTNLVPFIGTVNNSSDVLNADARCIIDFDVTTPTSIIGVENSTTNQIISIYYTLHAGGVYVRSETINYSAPPSPASGTSFTLPSDAIGNEHRTGRFKFAIGGLTNGIMYETAFRVKNTGGNSNYVNGVTLIPTSQAPAIANMAISTIYNGVDETIESNVKLTYTWKQPDAASYRSYSGINGDVITYNAGSEYSNAILRIGTTDVISNNSSNYQLVTTNAFTYRFTNQELLDVVADSNTSTNGKSFEIASLDLTQFGIATDDLETSGVTLYAQILTNTHNDSEADESFLQGSVSTGFNAYIQVKPTLDAFGVKVSVNLSDGEQTFQIDGTVPSQDNTGVKFTFNSSTNSTFGSIIGRAVLTNGQSTINTQSATQSYANLAANPIITAVLSQDDRNGTLVGGTLTDGVRTGGTLKEWIVESTPFQSTRFKTPNAPTITFSGNATDGSNLLTTLTDLTNTTDDYDVVESDINYELYNALTGGTPLVNQSYATLNASVDIVYSGYKTFDNYYLSARKYANLSADVVTKYTNYAIDGTARQNVLDASNQAIPTATRLGPFKRTTSASLVLNAITVDVNLTDGVQTFTFGGTISSLVASGATLTVTNGTTATSITDTAITINASGVMTPQTVPLTYTDLGSNQLITATISQPDLNNSGNFTMTSQVTFQSYAFMNPAAATGTLYKNVAGNDNKLIASSQYNDIGAMNGYDIINLSAIISGPSSAPEGGLLIDISGAFDEVVDTNATNDVSTSFNQTININSTNYNVDSSYTMVLKKSYKLPQAVYDLYNNNTTTFTQEGNIESTTIGPVYYMGNPTIETMVINDANDTITITANTHGTTLANPDAAFTLILVAKDGLGGYENGTNTGPMGTTVLTNSNISLVTGYDSTTVASTGNQPVSYLFDFSTLSPAITIDATATCIGIVDVTNGHSAVSLLNFPVVSDASYNSLTA